MTNGSAIGRELEAAERGQQCCLCGGDVERVAVTTPSPERRHVHYRCQREDCREGGVLIVDRLEDIVVGADGPVCDPRMARQYRQRPMCDGGFASEYDLEDALLEVVFGLEHQDWDRVEQALLAALSKVRERKQEVEA